MKKERNIPLWIGVSLFAVLLFVMYIGPYLPFIDKDLQRAPHRWVGEQLELPVYSPSQDYPLGSDEKGVDNLSKLVVAAKETIYIIMVIAAIRYLIGVPLGLLARKKKGIFHLIVILLNKLFSFLPPIFFVVLLLALPVLLFSESRLYWALFIIAAVEAGRVAVTVQEKAARISKELYVEAGTSLGLSSKRMIRKYYAPEMVPELIVNFCTDLGKVTLLLGQLALLNVFLAQEWREVGYYVWSFVNTQFNWATLIANHRTEIYMGKFAFVFYPAFAMAFAILTFNLLGEGFRRKFHIKS
ncbi:ABC transporter permease subunit [Paenibacillus faecalis]|uniref:ABC transporter permease subunit n=1 Tax=Paenibacillus faecalis TaxID=2079532 RepID=UPI000D0F7017|nr:ABC transporter permease subunit [Paenibacillus faecalis]